ncbi:hypothetical protein L195_g048105, partial [Trifolium pratense]
IMADMDPASIRAAVHRERQAKAITEYDRRVREDAERYGTATFHVGDWHSLEVARDRMRNNHSSSKRVQRIFITNIKIQPQERIL